MRRWLMVAAIVGLGVGLVWAEEPAGSAGPLVPARSAISAIRVAPMPRSAITLAAASRIWGLRM